MIFDFPVLNRVYNFVRFCPNYKQSIASTIDLICEMKFVCTPNIYKRCRFKISLLLVLNRVSRGFNPSAAHLYPNIGRLPPPPPPCTRGQHIELPARPLHISVLKDLVLISYLINSPLPFIYRYSATDALKFVGIERDVDFALR